MTSSHMKTIAVIPARMGSSRFPGKPIATLHGRPMLEHVYKRVALSPSLDATYIATCDEEIKLVAEKFGAKVIMTADTHERASDRVAEAITHLEANLIVMVQGDEPMTHPDMIDTAVKPFHHDAELSCVNLVRQIENESDFHDPNTIKVVMNQQNDAIFMSRQPIPTLNKAGFAQTATYKQVCIIPFRRQALYDYTNLEPTPLEQLESVDMLRLIEHGKRVKMVHTEFNTQAVDTESDLERVAELMANDPLLATY